MLATVSRTSSLVSNGRAQTDAASKEKPKIKGQSPRTKPLERPGREGGKRAENRKQRISALESASLRLFLQFGIEAVTIDQIVDGAQTAKGSFYRYFRDKEDIVDAIVSPVATEAKAAFERCATGLRAESSSADHPKHYQSLAEDLVRIVWHYPEIVRLYLHESRGPKSGARLPIVVLAEDILTHATLISDIAREQKFLRPLAGRLSAIVVVGAVELLLARIFAGDEQMPSLLEMPTQLVSLVLDGVRMRQEA